MVFQTRSRSCLKNKSKYYLIFPTFYIKLNPTTDYLSLDSEPTRSSEFINALHVRKRRESMGGFFSVASKSSCTLDLFYGVDYHSHLGTRRGGMAVFGPNGFNRIIHNIENSPSVPNLSGMWRNWRETSESDVSLTMNRASAGPVAPGQFCHYHSGKNQ